jgi:hypothetical protein
MADSTKSAKSTKPAKPRDSPAKRHTRGKQGAEPDDADLRARIAHRAYEISQSELAGDDADNWLRAEREVRSGA